MGLLNRIFKGNEEPLCRRPWFDPQSICDQKLTTYKENNQPIEVDSIESLKITQTDSFSPWNRFVVFQQAPPESCGVGEPEHLFDSKSAAMVAKTIRDGATRNLIIISGQFEPGAIRHFADTLISGFEQGGRTHLDMLGLFWYFDNEDIIDDPEHAEDVAYAVDRLQLKRLSILTGRFDSSCEDYLANTLEEYGNTSLQYAGVFQKEDTYQWPRYLTPRMDFMVKTNRNNIARPAL